MGDANVMRLRGGGQFSLRPHALTADGKTILACRGRSVQAFSAVTGEPLYKLIGHDAEVTAVVVDSESPNQAYTSSLDGTVRRWNLRDPSAGAEEFQVGEPIEGMALGASGEAWLSCHQPNKEWGRLLRYQLIPGAAGGMHDERRKISGGNPIVAGSRGGLLATHWRHTALVWSGSAGAGQAVAFTHTKQLACLALSPDDDTLAAGDVTGRILVWRGVRAAVAAAAAAGKMAGPKDSAAEPAPRLPQPATVHWHAHAVGALCFSADGAFLLSGGEEAVLVVWDFDGARRTYLPRLGGSVVSLARADADPALLAVGQLDNTLRVVNLATMRVQASVHGLRPLPLGPAPGPSPAVQPGTGHLVVPGSASTLQFYDMLRDSHVDRLQLSVHNPVAIASGEGGEALAPGLPCACQLAFSGDGGVLATCELRADAGSAASPRPVPVLKFWDRSQSGGYGRGYALACLADDPHRGGRGVDGLACSPGGDLVATASRSAREFRVWARAAGGAATTPAGERRGAWRCAAVGSYADGAVSAVAFSGDGSLLAAGIGDAVTLWDVAGMRLLATMPGPGDGAALTAGAASRLSKSAESLVFLAGTGLVVGRWGPGTLAVHSVLHGRMVWALSLPVLALAADPDSAHWAVLLASAPHRRRGAGDQDDAPHVVMFHADNSQPVAAWRLAPGALAPRPRSRRGDAPTPDSPALVFAGRSSTLASLPAACSHPGASPLVLVLPSREYAVLQRPGAEPTAKTPVGADAALTQESAKGLGAMFAEPVTPAGDATTADVAQPLLQPGKPAWTELLDAPSHALPPMSVLCPAFLNLVLSDATAAA